MLLALIRLGLFGPIIVSGQYTCSDPDWSSFGANCYKKVGHFNYAEATEKCHDFGGYVIMPKTDAEWDFVSFVRSNNGITEEVWIGLTEFESNGIWTWADGSVAPNNGIDASDFEDCVRLTDNGARDVRCSTSYMTICQRDANQAAPTTMSTTKEPISSVESETEVTSEHLSTALNVSSHISSVLSTTSTEQPQGPTQTTTFTDNATAKTTHTQTDRIRSTTSSSPKGKSNCSQSSTNSCRCQKRTVANTTENQEMQTLKVTDYIWLNKCTLQPMIDSGMIKVSNCPYVCKCSPKGSSTNVQEDMFACVRRP